MLWDTFGLEDANATSKAVIGLIWLPTLSTDGSGHLEERGSLPKASAIIVTGPLLEGKKKKYCNIWIADSRNLYFSNDRPQPDNREQRKLGGEDEACIAILNNFYGDGLKWHDVGCSHKKPIICEEIPELLDFALADQK